ncbi:hypothetical protein [Staphylococcus phage vB_SauM-V1SA22]|nr:hypothetical protein [Staphylococcus phage vB_SauM-V1SA22]
MFNILLNVSYLNHFFSSFIISLYLNYNIA